MKYKNYISTTKKKKNADYILKEQSLKKQKYSIPHFLGIFCLYSSFVDYLCKLAPKSRQYTNYLDNL